MRGRWGGFFFVGGGRGEIKKRRIFFCEWEMRWFYGFFVGGGGIFWEGGGGDIWVGVEWRSTSMNKYFKVNGFR